MSYVSEGKRAMSFFNTSTPTTPMPLTDEGFMEEEMAHIYALQADAFNASQVDDLISGRGSLRDTEELAFKLLATLPRSKLAAIQRRIAPLLQFDVVGSLPTEVSLQIFSFLPYPTLLVCALVSKRWQDLSNDQALWKALCQARGWRWKPPQRALPGFGVPSSTHYDNSDDEGMGDSDGDEDDGEISAEAENGVEAAKAELTTMSAELDSGFASMSLDGGLPTSSSSSWRQTLTPANAFSGHHRRNRHSAPSVLDVTHGPSTSFHSIRPDYKLLYQTHTKLHSRILRSNYQMTALQTRGAPADGHTNTIYCLQLYTYPKTGRQVLFTGSRDKTIREWNLETGSVSRRISDVHQSSVLSLCVRDGYLASAGSDRRVVLWHLETNKLVKVLSDHEQSVLCVRFDSERLVSCSKDRTVRVYSFPELEFQYRLDGHTAAVNAVSISDSIIISASGDRSVKLWDAKTGSLLRTLNNHHSRGIASIDFNPPMIMSGSSDKHIRLFDITNFQGWATSPDYDTSLSSPTSATGHANALAPLSFSANSTQETSALVCQTCGSSNIESATQSNPAIHRNGRCVHTDLVRSVALGDEFAVSGSYDISIKVWDRKTGALVADLTRGHVGRIFCIGMDSKKIVSCGEDQRIIIWDFSHGIDTSFIEG